MCCSPWRQTTKPARSSSCSPWPRPSRPWSWIQPQFGTAPALIAQGAFRAYGSGLALGSAVWDVVHPVRVLGRLTNEHNFHLLVTLLAPLLFLPVLAPSLSAAMGLTAPSSWYTVVDVRDAMYGQRVRSADHRVRVRGRGFARVAWVGWVDREGSRRPSRADRHVGGGRSACSSFGTPPARPTGEPWEWGAQERPNGARDRRLGERSLGDAGSVRASPSRMPLLAGTRASVRTGHVQPTDRESATDGVDTVCSTLARLPTGHPPTSKPSIESSGPRPRGFG